MSEMVFKDAPANDSKTDGPKSCDTYSESSCPIAMGCISGESSDP